MARLIAFPLVLFLAFGGLSSFAAAEIDDLESQFEQEAEASSDSDDLEWLLFLEQHPLDLNQVTASELSALPFLSSEEASAIVSLRKKMGRFGKVGDLSQIENLEADKVDLLKHYLTVALPVPPAFHAEATLKLKRETPKAAGFGAPADSSRYLGNDLWVRSGIRFSYGESYRLILGTFKGAGEKDYADAVVFGAERKTDRTHLVVGHYVLSFAQGLAFGRLHGFSRFSGKLLASEQSAEALRPYQGSAPGRAFQGGAGKASFGSLALWTFASRQALDATWDPSSGEVRTILGEGEHRSPDEKAKKDVLREEMAGGRVSYGSGERLSVGMTGYLSRDNPSLSPEWDERRVYDFRGVRNSVLAADAAISLGSGKIFAEGAQSYGGGNAGTLGGIWKVFPWAFTFTAWHYDPDFHNAYAWGPCHVEPANETGALLMGKGSLSSKTHLLGYYEEYHHPWRRYDEAFPTTGYELGGEAAQPLGRSFELILRRKISQTEENVAGDNGASSLQPFLRFLTRWEGLWRASPKTSLRLRFEQVRSLTGRQASRGTGLGLMLRQKLGRTWRLSSSLAVFHTDSYDSRLYQYEEDLPGVLTNSVLSGRGRKATLYLEGSPFKSISCSFRYANAYYYNQTVVGSGLDSRPGNLVQEFGLGLTARD